MWSAFDNVVLLILTAAHMCHGRLRLTYVETAMLTRETGEQRVEPAGPVGFTVMNELCCITTPLLN